MNLKNINEKEYSNFSQNGEDGIIDFLSSQISENKKKFVEIGCGNGLENNTTNLILNDWSGIVFDIPENIRQYIKLLKIINPQKKIIHASGKVSLKNIRDLINILKNETINFFSLDIDSYDFYIMLEILKNNIYPQIICVEYNSFLGSEPLTIKYNENFYRYSYDKERGLYFGASLEAWKLLLNKFDYDFICVDKSGVNAFFVLPSYFDKNIINYSGLQFQYTKIFENKYNLPGEVLEKELLDKFKNELINIKDLI